MNWGLFLALVGFLLPLSLVVRVAAQFMIAGVPIGEPIQAMRIGLLLLLGVPLSGKTPAMLYATTGNYGELGQLTETYMVTNWGLLQTALMLAAVAACDLFAPRIVAQLQQRPLSEAKPTLAYLLRDVGIVAVCLVLAWLGQR